MIKQKNYYHIDNTELFYCPKCNKKELVFSHVTDLPYCQVCGKYVEPEPDTDEYEWYHEMFDIKE